MSVANIALTDRQVQIVTDTCTYDGKQPVEWNRKVALRSDARLALTLRGKRWLAQAFDMASEPWPDFAHASEAAPRVIPDLLELGEREGRTPGDGFELTLAGWQDGPKVMRLIWRPRQDVQQYRFAPGVYLTPSLGKQDIPLHLTDDQLVGIAQVQQTVSRKHGLNLCIGGDVELTTVSASGLTIRKIGEYADKEMMSRRIAAATPAMRARAAA